jgi:hypothetical protein
LSDLIGGGIEMSDKSLVNLGKISNGLVEVSRNYFNGCPEQAYEHLSKVEQISKAYLDVCCPCFLRSKSGDIKKVNSWLDVAESQLEEELGSFDLKSVDSNTIAEGSSNDEDKISYIPVRIF